MSRNVQPNAIRPWKEALERAGRLTARESEVFDALGNGLSNAQIANALAISERTVKFHISEIRAKLGLESRLQIGIVSCIRTLDSVGPPS